MAVLALQGIQAVPTRSSAMRISERTIVALMMGTALLAAPALAFDGAPISGGCPCSIEISTWSEAFRAAISQLRAEGRRRIRLSLVARESQPALSRRVRATAAQNEKSRGRAGNALCCATCSKVPRASSRFEATKPLTLACCSSTNPRWWTSRLRMAEV
jgi:hypothetical protein